MNIGTITVAFEVTEEDGSHRNVWFDVPAADEFFQKIVLTRWQEHEAQYAAFAAATKGFA